MDFSCVKKLQLTSKKFHDTFFYFFSGGGLRLPTLPSGYTAMAWLIGVFLSSVCQGQADQSNLQSVLKPPSEKADNKAGQTHKMYARIDGVASALILYIDKKICFIFDFIKKKGVLPFSIYFCLHPGFDRLQVSSIHIRKIPIHHNV